MPNKIFFWQLKEHTVFAAWIVALLFCVASGLFFAYKAFTAKNYLETALLVFALPFVIFATLIAFRLWGGMLADNFIFSLLASRKTLKEAPLILSPYAGMVARGEGLAALADLEELFAQYPDTPEIAGMLAEVYLRDAEAPDQFIQLVENYFARPKRTAGPDNLTLLMLYADLRGGDALPLLAGEVGRNVYMPSEQKAIRNRIETLTEKS